MADKTIKRTNRIEIRCSDEELEIMRNRAFAAGLQLAVYLRESGLNKELRTVPSPEEKERLFKAQRCLSGVANNLNQIVRQMHIEGFTAQAKETVNLINAISEIIYHELG